MGKSRKQLFWEWMKGSLFVNLLLIFSAGLGGYSAYRIFGEALAVRREYKRSFAEIEALRHEKAELEVRIRELQSSEAMEREGKANSNLKMPGEEVVVVVPEKEEPGEQLAGAKKTPWERIKTLFGIGSFGGSRD